MGRIAMNFLSVFMVSLAAAVQPAVQTPAMLEYARVSKAIYPSFDEKRCGTGLREVISALHSKKRLNDKAWKVVQAKVAALQASNCVDQYFSATPTYPGPSISKEKVGDHCYEGKVDEKFPPVPVDVSEVADKVVLVRVKTFEWYFYDCTNRDPVWEAMAKIVAAEVHNAAPRQVILDLRDNTGGSLDAARNFLNEVFSPSPGELIVEEVHADGEVERLRTDRTGVVPCPTVVIVNGASASASEIVIGAIRSWCPKPNTFLIGGRTFGKGITQLLQPFPRGILRYTDSEYFSDDQRKPINHVGFEPDIPVATAQAVVSKESPAEARTSHDVAVELALVLVRHPDMAAMIMEKFRGIRSASPAAP
jgi:hypothetical protein